MDINAQATPQLVGAKVKQPCQFISGSKDIVIAMIGRNEKGLTLSREAVGHIMKNFSAVFNPTNEFQQLANLEMPATSFSDSRKILGAAILRSNKCTQPTSV